MARRKKGSSPKDLTDEARALAQKLLDNEPLRDAVNKLIETTHTAPGAKPAKGRKAKKAAAAAAQAQAEAAKKGKKGKKKCKGKKLVTLAGIGGIGALATSEPLRSKVLDALFGAEEEFQYTPPAASPPDAGADGPAAA